MLNELKKRGFTHLNMNIKSTRSAKNIATLSIVRSITTSW